MVEAGYPGVVFTLWVRLLAPAGTPADIMRDETAKWAKVVKAANITPQ